MNHNADHKEKGNLNTFQGMIERENRVLELIRSELYPIDDNKNALLANIHKLHTTELGIERIRRNLQLQNENLVRESFWNVYRPGCLEHYVLNQLRTDEAFVPELDFVMEKDGKLIGQNMFMRAKIQADDGRDIPIMTMGPIGIAPEFKRQGYGKILLDYSLEKAAENFDKQFPYKEKLKLPGQLF